MKFYQCKCGRSKSFGSRSPFACSFCTECNTKLASHPSGHSTERIPHNLIKTRVKTDDGYAVLSRCKWCMKTRVELVECEESFVYADEPAFQTVRGYTNA